MNCDVVFTTYATLAADHKKQKVLRKIQWYRLVLDEGKFDCLLHLFLDDAAT